MPALLDFFKTRADQPLVTDDPATIKRRFERKRWSVFLSVTFGYGFFYVARINFSVAKRPLLDEQIFTPTEMGLIGTALLFVYAFGKLINGFLSDRANIARFMSTALLLSSVVNLMLGFTTLFWLFVVLWGLNGWFQSVGSAPSAASLSQWFSQREIGTRYGIWSSSHGLGTAFTFIATAALVAAFGWRWGFWGPGLICGAVALIMYHTMADRPETYGLPSAAEYKDDHPPKTKAKVSVSQVQKAVLTNPAIWVLGIASALMYVARYGINNWGVLYLQDTKGYDLVTAGSVLGAYTIATVLGAVASGIISDRLFNADRNRPALLHGIINVAALVALYLIPPGHIWLDSMALFAFGFALGVLLAYLGGLMAIDLSSKRAAGAAMGMIGGFSYLGAAIQDTVSGVLIDDSKMLIDLTERYAFTPAAFPEAEWFLNPCSGCEIVYAYDAAMYFWIGTAALSVLLTLTVWKAKPVEG